jgi:aminopeptidase N
MEIEFQNQNMPTVKYPPSLIFTIENLWLRIEPDFVAKKILGEEQLKILAMQKIDGIDLDIGEAVEIKSVFFSTGAGTDTAYDKRELKQQIENGKLHIPLEYTINEGERFYLIIKYIAENSESGLGFHFESGDTAFPAHAWTLSESIYARNWFPCLDHPQIKFPREVSVVVPEELIVLSNGELDITEQEIQTGNGSRKRKFVWEQPNPDAAYLTCVVIGKFLETSKGENYNGIPLRYYVPHGREADAQRTFKNTSKMIKIFEEYLNVKYPYNKYTQVVVKGLAEAGADGMEHTSCTTLDIDDVLSESATPEDRIRHDVIAHELAHQWFGDLVTCRDWQDIWLNEGFAAFFEAVYFEKITGNQQEYQTYIMKMAQRYLRATKDPRQKTPIRAIVTNKYEHPDDMFDHNTYYKGGIVLHMIRSLIGDEDFRKSLCKYLELFKYKTAETDGLRQILEETSGINLQQFFKQWIYREGHPKIDLEISEDHGMIKLVLTQKQEGDAFVFPLEILFVLSSTKPEGNNEQNQIVQQQIQITEKTFSKTFNVSLEELDHIVIDPEYKILKEYLQFLTPNNLIATHLQDGKTIVSKIRDSSLLRQIFPASKAALSAIDLLLLNSNRKQFTAKATEPNASSQIDKNDDTDEQAYRYLVNSLKETSDPGIRRKILDSVGHFRKTDSFDLLKGILQNDDGDPYERYFAAVSIGNTEHAESLHLLKTMAETNSYHNLVARGAIEGLKIIAINSKDKTSKEEVVDFIIDKIKSVKESRLRRAATSSLGYIARYDKNSAKVVDHLKELLYDESVYVRNTACVAIANALEGTNDPAAIQALSKIASEDANPIVRATARSCIDVVKDHVNAKGNFGVLGEETKIDSKYKSEKFDMLEEIRVLP